MRFSKFSHYSGIRPSLASLSLHPISMASSTKLISLLFFLALLSSLRTHARESKFFSKATATNANESTAPEVIPNKEQEALSKQEQEPSFIPEAQNGYGLYGHEAEQLTPTTAAAAATTTNNNNENYYYNNGGSNYNTQKQGMSDTRFLENGKYFYDVSSEKNYNPNGFRQSRGVVDYSSNNNNNNFYNGHYTGFNTQQQDSADTQLMGRYSAAAADVAANRYYNTQKQGMSDTRFLENGKYYHDINGEKSRAVDEYNKNNNYYYHNGANGYNSQRQQQDFTNSEIYNAGGRYYGEPQGMSDTRFVENGKYYYNPNSESSRGVEHFNRRGYYGNNGNTYEYSNSVEGYQNQQEQFQEGEEEEDQYVP